MVALVRLITQVVLLQTVQTSQDQCVDLHLPLQFKLFINALSASMIAIAPLANIAVTIFGRVLLVCAFPLLNQDPNAIQ